MDANGVILPRDGAIVPTGVFYVVSPSNTYAQLLYSNRQSGSSAVRVRRSYE